MRIGRIKIVVVLLLKGEIGVEPGFSENLGWIPVIRYSIHTLKGRMRKKGKITSWNDDRGFGFISPQTGDKRVFVHIRGFDTRNCRPQVDDPVTYAMSRDKQGRPCAVNVTIIGAEPKRKTTRMRRTPAILFALLFLGAIGASVMTDRLPAIIAMAYVALSLFSFVAYALDKSAARRGAWRTKEGTLHLLALAGGWPGALIAQQTLRHKSKKTSFRIVFWVTVLLNCFVLVWMHTESGQTAMEVALKNIVSGLEPGKSDNWYDP